QLPPSDSSSSHTEPTPTPLPADSIIASHDNTAVDDDVTKNFPASGKTYLDMTEQEKKKFIEQRAARVARMIGNREGEAVTPEAVLKIKSFVDTYAIRLRSA